MRHQKGRRDCSYNSSLRCLSFTRCLSAILCPIFLENKLHSFVFLTESAVWLSSLPCLPFPPEAHPYTKAHGSWFCIFSKPTRPAIPFPFCPVGSVGRAASPPLLGSVQPWWQLPVLPPSPWHGPWHWQPGWRARRRGTVASAELRLLPSPGYFR